LTIAAALANSTRLSADRPALAAFVRAMAERLDLAYQDDCSEDSVAELRALRARVNRLWAVDESVASDIVNGILASSDTGLRLAGAGSGEYRIQPWNRNSCPLSIMKFEVGVAFASLICSGELWRLRICAAEACDKAFVDLSKNRSRRFCDMQCSNRSNVSAYRLRARQLAELSAEKYLAEPAIHICDVG
jgi:predicted RNA-binding Zn ribbon-like protein